MVPIFSAPTRTRLWAPSRCVYIPALAWSWRTVPSAFSVQMRANAASRCHTSAAAQWWSTTANGPPRVSVTPMSAPNTARRARSDSSASDFLCAATSASSSVVRAVRSRYSRPFS